VCGLDEEKEAFLKAVTILRNLRVISAAGQKLKLIPQKQVPQGMIMERDPTGL
jgi:hypothetical protein